MAYFNQNFTLFAGEDRRVFVQVFDMTGAPLDLTTYAGTNFMWGMMEADGTLLTKTGAQITISLPLNGTLYFDIDDGDTVDIPAGCYTQQLQITDPVTGKIGIGMQGVVTLLDNVFSGD